MSTPVVISACRTPIGSFGGVFRDVTAVYLGQVVIEAAVVRAGVAAAAIDEVIMGNVVQAGQGQNPARQSARYAGVPDSVPAMTVNMVCGSGLRSVALAAQGISHDDGGIYVAGGMESMSRAPFASLNFRWGHKMGNAPLLDLMLWDGLEDAFGHEHSGAIADRWSAEYGISREEQDQFALGSQQDCARATAEGRFRDEVVPVVVIDKPKPGTAHTVDRDEYPRPDTTLEGLAKLGPVFAEEGTVTAVNASGINDGAAAVVVTSLDIADQMGVLPLAQVLSWAVHAQEPTHFGKAPVGAVRKALQKADLSLDDIDLIESNEAFAVQTIALGRELGWDWNKVNVNGGAIALGHPIGCSGARILTTLLHELKRRDQRNGLATMCVGGGMGIAMIVQRCKD